MTSANRPKTPDQSSDQSSDQSTEEFSWESLPEVAKDRWEEMVAYSSTVESQLSKAKASRTQAETERQRIASETLDATKEACRAVVADSKRTLMKLKSQVAETEENYAESRRQLERALSIRKETDDHRESTLASVEKQAQEILLKATHAAEVECARLRKQASLDSYQLLAQAEAMRASAQEELEAQKIYAEAAMLKADAYEALGDLQARLEEPEDALESAFRAGDNEGSPESAIEGSPSKGLLPVLGESPATGSQTAEGQGGSPSGQEAAQPSPGPQETTAPVYSKSGAKGSKEKAA